MADNFKPVEATKKFWTGSRLFNLAVSGYFGYDTYKEERAQGNSRLGALGKATMDFVLPELLGFKAYLAYEAVKALPGAALSAGQYISQQGRIMERNARDQAPFKANTFVDSQQIYTMRQAGMALAEQSKYALQQSLMGDEARFMHR